MDLAISGDRWVLHLYDCSFTSFFKYRSGIVVQKLSSRFGMYCVNAMEMQAMLEALSQLLYLT